MSKRELQGPDKFQTEAGSVFDWAQDHPREVALGGVGLLAIIVAIGLIFGGDSDRGVDREAGAQLAEALELVDRPVGADAPAGEEAFATEREKQEAIVAALEKVRADHAGTSTAVAATLPLADARYKLGEYDQALALYEEYLDEAPKDAQLRFLALEGRAQTLQAQGRTEEALQAWDRLAKEAPAYEDRALYGKGLLLEQQERWDDARAAYQEVREAHADGAIARLAAERLGELDRTHPPAATAEEGQ